MSAALATATTAVLVAVAVRARPSRGHRGRVRSAGGPPAPAPAGGSSGYRGVDGSDDIGDVVLIDLVVAALEAGLPTAAAVAAARSATAPSALDPPGAAAARPSPAAVVRAFELAERTGASAAELLRRAAADERSARQAATAVAASRLGVRLVVPLGLTILPAFVLLGVAPVVIGLAQQLLVG